MGLALFVAFIGLLLAACLCAYLRGGGPERAVATMFLAAWIISTATRTVFRLTLKEQLYQSLAYSTLVIDVLLLIGLLAVAGRANRAWPVVVSALQVLVVLAHAARVINQHQLRTIYIFMTEFWPYLQLSLLIAGTWLHSRREATNGAEPSWRS